MKAELWRHNGIYFLYLDFQTIVPMKEEDVKEFLRNYADYNYYNKLVERYSIPALKRRFSKDPEKIAIVDDNNDLLIKDPSFLKTIYTPETEIKFITIEEFAEKYGKKRAIVSRLCNYGRIPGARFVNSVWLIPSDAPYPEDARKNKELKCVEPALGLELNYNPDIQRRKCRKPVTVNTEE